MISDKMGVAGSKGRLLLMLVAIVIAAHVAVGLGQSPADGGAVTEEPERISLWSTIVSGGIVGLLIILASLTAVALTVENFFSIRRDRMVPPDLIEELREHIRAKRYGEAQQACTENGSFVAHVIGAGLGQLGAMFGFFDMQNAMQEVSEREVSKLYRKLEYLSFIASTSPMLGLLGTVTGMIKAFNRIAATQGTASASELAGGISMALVTTCMGLVVAIPTMFFVAFFRRRIDGFVAESETVVEKLMGHFRKGKG